ncbi:DedA family protein [bacterium]|nr:DedA family protein [bacterium]
MSVDLNSVLQTLVTYLQQPETLIASAGLIGLTLIIFAETGLLLGFFLPGDSLLFSAGLYAAGGHLDIWPLAWALTASAILGDATGYWIGRRLGPALYNRRDSLLFKRKHLEQTREFYEKHGGKTIVLARFIPVVRTFAPTVAGIAGMPYKEFATFNIAGGFLWIWSLLFAGYLLGQTVPGIKDYIHVIVVAIVILSVLPIALKWLKAMRGQARVEAKEETSAP